MTIRTNLRVLKRSSKLPERGDTFVMNLTNKKYLFGRVILANAPQERAPMPGANLVYIYDWQSATPVPEYSQLRPGRLVIPPVWTNRLGWTKGYFQTVDNCQFGDFDLLRQHCFFRAALSPAGAGKFVDEFGRELKQRIDPCGEWGLVSYRWIDDRVSDAVGIPRVPVE